MANLVIAGMLIVVQIALASLDRIWAIRMGLLLILLASLVIWGMAMALYVADRSCGRMIHSQRTSRRQESGVWDDWQDGV